MFGIVGSSWVQTWGRYQLLQNPALPVPWTPALPLLVWQRELPPHSVLLQRLPSSEIDPAHQPPQIIAFGNFILLMIYFLYDRYDKCTRQGGQPS